MEYAWYRVLPDDRPDGLYNISDITVRLLYGNGTDGADGTVAVASFQMGTFNVPQQGARLTSSLKQCPYSTSRLAFLHVDHLDSVRTALSLGDCISQYAFRTLH